MRSAHIVLFLPSFERGGIEKNAGFIGRILCDAGFRVSLLYGRPRRPLNDSQIDERIWQLNCPVATYAFLHPRIEDAISMTISGARLLRRLQVPPSLIIGLQTNVAAIAVGRLIETPSIVRISNHYASAAMERSLLRHLSELAKRVTYPMAARVVAVSEELASDYSVRLGRTVKAIPNPVRLGLDRISESELTREKTSGPAELLAVGRLVKQKDFGTLIRAMPLVLEHHDCVLRIVGDGQERARLERQVCRTALQNVVRFEGFRYDLESFFTTADLFVSSSKYEGFPNAMLEAIAAGVPVVSTDCKTGPKEILLSGRGGWLCEVGSARGLADAIVEALDFPMERESRRRVALGSLERYSEPRIGSEWIGLVEEVLV